MMPFSRSAISSASADLPLAVGPAIRIASLMIPSPESDPPFPMPFIATLVAGPRSRALSTDLAHRAARSVGASKTVWLADGIACDLMLPAGANMREAEAALRASLASEPVDVAVQEIDGRRKQILIADMDSTMIDQECIDELADEIGIKAEVAAITARSMNGEIAFEPALRERVALLKGLETAVISKVLERRIAVAAGAVELVRTMRSHGAWTALVSGGFDA